LKLQENALPKPSDNEPAADVSKEYQRYLDIALIKIMEGELDLSSHATKTELRALNDDIFAKYYAKVKAAHKQLWEFERVDRKAPVINGASRDDLAASQTTQRKRFDNSQVNGIVNG